MRSDELEDVLINKLSEYFNKAVRDFVVSESTETPFLQLTIEMTLYNYCVVKLSVEKSTIFFSIVQSGFQFPLFKSTLSEGDIDNAVVLLEKEVRLRIPDKYLQAKGW